MFEHLAFIGLGILIGASFSTLFWLIMLAKNESDNTENLIQKASNPKAHYIGKEPK